MIVLAFLEVKNMTPLIKLFYDLGCDLNSIPSSDYELAVLIMRFVAVLSLVWLCLKFLLLITRNMLGGKW